MVAMSRSPEIKRHGMRAAWIIFALCTPVALYFGLQLGLNANPTLGYRLQQQTINAAQNQAKLKSNHLATVGPPATDISKGNATAEPTQNAPTTPARTYVVVTGPSGRQGPGPSNAQVKTAVEHYFAAHPVKPPVSAAQITAQAATYVARYLREHPAPEGPQGSPGPTGSPGGQGVQGPGPTDQQIATAVQSFLPAAVANYLIANPPASGATGPQGEVGPSGGIGPSGGVGPSGPAGSNGTDGSNGAPPASWVWTDPGTGVQHTCTRDPGSPDNAPTYTCDSVIPSPTP